MAEEAKGQKFSQRTGGLLDKVTGNQGTQQTQQTQQDTSGQQATGGIFLPGISGIQDNVSTANGFSQGIQDGTIKSNIVLPGITSKPNEATLDTTTMKQKRQSYIYAKNNNIDTNSINEQIEEERTGSNKVLGQTGKILKTYREAPVNNIKKRGVRAIADSGLPGYFVDKTLEKAGVPDGIGDNIKDAVNETARKVAITYQNKVNEDFQEKVNKNIDPKIREKYDNESITDLIGKGDGAGARYKIWKGTVENWNMIPEIGLMFVNPYIGLATMGTDVYVQENQGTFEDMLQNGATYEQARDGAVVVGILNAGIELLMERALGGAKRAGATALRRLFLKNAQKEVVRQATKKGMAEIFSKGVGEWLRGSMVEGFEEVLQQIVGNIMVKMVNPDRDITEGARESFEGGFYNLFNAIGGVTNSINDIRQNEEIQKNADIEALKYVMEGEQRKAQRMAKEQARAKFLERLKNPTMDNGYTPTQEEAEQRAKENEDREQFEQERDDEYKREIQIENDMMNEVLNEGDLNEDLGDPRYQKKEISATDESEDSSSLADQSPTGRVKISPENSSEITKSLDEIKNNLNDLKADTFLQQIKKSISGNEKNSNYVVNKINGMNYVLRVSDHHANSYQFDNSKQRKRNTSIVIKLAQKSKFKKNKNVDLAEFVYDPANMTTEKMQGIIDGIQNWIKTGKYTDTNYDSKNQSTRKRGDAKYQLKYEEKGYNPGVAGKNEKSISGKEGVNLRSKLNKQTIKQLAEKYGIKVEVIEGMIEIIENRVKKGEAYGKYIDQVLTLSEQIKESTAPHELLHAIFDMIDPETKAYLISQVMQSEGWSAKKAEEWLADSFSNFFRTGKIEGAPKSTWGKIKMFFKRVRSFINGLGKWRSQLEEIFTDIIESEGIEDLQGKIDQNKSLNEAKEKMRKRFLEYSKNAQKTQKKVKKSEAKLQKAEDQTQSKAFKKRFGDSKVVDENGNPLVVYHGTEMKFNTFGRGNGEHGKGFYFTDDMDYAEEFSGEDGDTMEVYLKMVKPLRENVDMNSPEMKNFIKGIKDKRGLSEKQIKDCFVNEDWSSELSSKIAKKMGYGKKDVEKTVGWEFEDIDEIGETDYNAYLGAYAWENGLNDLVRESGFDGIISKIYNSDAEGLEYIAFKPNQIKSATDNVGTFDANNDDIRYQTADDIDPNIQSPRDMVELWGRERVIKKYISEQQKKKALDVSKNILVNDGGRLDGHPYMWMHTNKYSSNIIADFQNIKDSRYKEFSDQGIVVSFFSNNREMSRSYADQKSDLANTKKFKSIEEFNERFDNISQDGSNVDSDWKENGIGKWVRHEYYKKLVKEGDGYVLEEHDLEGHKYKDLETLAKNRGKDADELSEKEIIKGIEDRVTADFITDPDLHLYDDVKIRKENGEYILEMRINKELGRYKSEKEALARGRSDAMMKGIYHYNGIIQNMHNPLVIDKEYYGNESTPNWNRLGTAYDVLMKSPKAKRGLNKIKKKLAELERGYNEIYSDLSKSYEAKKKLQGEREEAVSKMIAEKQETVDYVFDIRDKITANTNGRKKIQNFFKNGGELEKLTPEEANSNIGDGETMQDVWNKAKKMYDDNKEFFEAIKRPDNALTSDWYTSPQIEGFQNYLIKLGGFDAGDTSLFHNVYLNTYGDFFWKLDIDKQLKEKFMTTNDYVFYALNKGGYDGVIFKHISDYGGESPDHIGGDVLATFKSNQFKSWDNADPTDSEFISYQRTEDNEGRALSVGQAEYFNNSRARVDEDLNKPLVRVYHTTTNMIIPFTEFNPVGTDGYRFRDQIVNYYTDDEDMSGSYAHQNYKKYTGTANLYTRADVDKFIEKINKGDYHNYVNGEKLNYEIREVGPNDGLGKDAKYGIYQMRDEKKLARDRKIYESLTPIQKEVVDGIVKYGALDYYFEDVYQKDWDKMSFEERMKLREKEQELDKAKEDLYNIIEEKSDRNEFFDQFKADVKKGKWTGFSYKSERDLIRKIEEDVKYKINGASNWMYEGYVNLTNPFIVDAEGRNWNTVRTDSKYVNETKDTWRRMSQADKDRITDVVRKAKEEFEAGKDENEWNRFDYSEENPDLGMVMGEIFPEEFLMDLADMEWAGDGSIQKMVDAVLNGMTENDIINVIASGDTPETTNDVVISIIKSNKAGETNYDGIIIKNVVDYGGKSNKKPAPHNLYVTFASNQFKSIYNENPTEDADIRYQTVYHGSQADFDKFDSSHMGEGEGAQAHGWGHYVAVNPKTGRHYAELNHYDNEVEIKGKTITNPEDLWDVRYYVRGLYRDIFQYFAMGYNELNEEDLQNIIDRHKADLETTIEWYEKLIKDPGKPIIGVDDTVFNDALTADRKKAVENYKQALEELDDLTIDDVKVRPTSKKRHLYEVEIPDPVKADTPTGSNYIEEQKKITLKQRKDLIKRLRNIKKDDDHFQAGVNFLENKLYAGQFKADDTWKDVYEYFDEGLLYRPREVSEALQAIGYDGIHYDGQKDGECYVIFDDNDLEIKNHERYQIAEYDYDDNGNRKWLKFGDNSEFDPSIFGTPTKEEQIEEDKENEKSSPFYNAWVRYNNQNYKDDQLTLEEFINKISKRGDKEQEIYDQKMRDLSEAQNDPQLLDLQLRAVKLMEEEGKVGKKFGKNVSKEVRDRQQREVESKREKLVQDIVDYMYPGLKTEEITYDMQKEADQKEADWEMLGREDIEEKLKYFKKDKNGNREAKEIKIENPDIKLEKILSSGKFDEIFTPVDRVIEWKTPQGQKGRIDRLKDPAKYKRFFEKIYDPKTKTKVEVKDVTKEVRALERYRADEQAEKERRKKEKQEEYAKKKQEEYKRLVRMKAFQRLVDMQRFEKYPFLTEEEIKNRYGFSDEEWKTITEQEEIKLPKKRGEKAISDFNKAVDDQVKYLIEGLNWQNTMKRKEAEKNLGEIGEIDVDILLGRDEERGQKEVEEFERIAKEEKEQDSKLEDGKTEFEKEMDRKTRKQKKQAEKLTKQWNEMFRKAEEKRNERYANKEEKKIDEVKSVDEAKALTKDSRWKRTKKFWKDTTIQDLIQPISSRIEKISPRIYLEMMRFEQRIAIKQNIRMKQVEDFVKKMAQIRKSNKKDYLNITLHLLNGNVGTANQMLEKYGTSIPRQVLDEIWADAEDVGYTMNYEGFYYPRKVKDVQEFLDRFAKTENKDVQGEIDKVIKKAEEKARKRGEEFTPQQKADLINQLLMDGEVEGISLGSGHMKKRKVDSITKNMLEFYEDPVDSILQYINGMTEAIEKARFLGQGTRGEIKTLGEFIADEGISGYDADELKKLLLSRFNYAPMGEMMSKLKVSANIIHLGSPSSALSQLADVSFSLIENGLANIVQGLAKRYNLDLDALGITNRGEELKTQGKNETKWEKIQRFTFKWTGFNMMDQFGKKLLVVSTLNKLIRYAKNNDPQLRKDLSRRFDDPKMIDGVIEDLKVGKMSENVNLFLFTKLADVQPLTRTQMTRTYLQAGNWRVLYAFKTFGIKQLDYIIQKSRRELQTKPTAKALWSIVTMLGIIMLCGAGDDELKDFSMGRKYSSWIWRMIEGNDWSASQLSDRFWDNFLKLFGFTKYSIYQARTQGIKSAIEDIFFSLPGLDMFTYPLQDIQNAMGEDGLDFSQASSWQLIPIVGKYGYWWAGAGQTKQQKSLEKEKKKSTKKKSTGSTRKPLSR